MLLAIMILSAGAGFIAGGSLAIVYCRIAIMLKVGRRLDRLEKHEPPEEYKWNDDIAEDLAKIINRAAGSIYLQNANGTMRVNRDDVIDVLMKSPKYGTPAHDFRPMSIWWRRENDGVAIWL
jgi:hypothetical protein